MLYLNQKEIENFVKYVKVKESGFMVTVTNAKNDNDNKDELLTAIIPLDLMRDSLDTFTYSEDRMLLLRYVENIKDTDLDEIAKLYK